MSMSSSSVYKSRLNPYRLFSKYVTYDMIRGFCTFKVANSFILYLTHKKNIKKCVKPLITPLTLTSQVGTINKTTHRPSDRPVIINTD